MSDPLRWSVEGRRVRLAEGPGMDPMTLATMLGEVVSRERISIRGLAARVGRSSPWVSNIMSLLRLDPAVQQMVRSGAISVSHAKAISRLPAESQVQLAQRCVKFDLSSHALEGLARREKVR